MNYSNFLNELIKLEQKELKSWIDSYLKGLDTNLSYDFTIPERNLVIKKIFEDSNDLYFHKRMQISLRELLLNAIAQESYIEYTYYLLLSILDLKPDEIEQKLKQMLISDVYSDLESDSIDLFKLILLSNIIFNFDDQIKEYIFFKLPQRKLFKNYSIPVYNSLLSKYTLESFYFIPYLIEFFSEPPYFNKFSMLFSFSIKNVGYITFSNCYFDIKLLIIDKDPDNIWLKAIQSILYNSIENSSNDDKLFHIFSFVSMYLDIIDNLNLSLKNRFFQKIIEPSNEKTISQITSLLTNFKLERKRKNAEIHGYRLLKGSDYISKERNRSVLFEDNSKVEIHDAQTYALLLETEQNIY